MNTLLALTGIAGALAVGVVSPGPSFVMIARTAISSSRAEGLAAALGMGLGGVCFAMAALVGLQSLLLAVPSFYLAFKVIGGLYLAYLGLRIWRGATQPLTLTMTSAHGRAHSIRRALALGFATQVSNPKTAIVYASVFAGFLPPHPTLELSLAIAAIVFTLEAGWYVLVALALSAEHPRNAYLRYKGWIDRIAGGVMMTLGLKLASSAQHG